MITRNNLVMAFDRNLRIVEMQTEGLAHEQSLIQLPFRANSLNWIVGHLVVNRNNVLKLLGAEKLIDPTHVDRYRRDSEPVTPDSPDALPLEQLMAMLTTAQENIAVGLESLADDELKRRLAFFGNREMSVAEWLFFFYFHDCYHTGQAEIMRQAAGVDDKVI